MSSLGNAKEGSNGSMGRSRLLRLTAKALGPALIGWVLLMQSGCFTMRTADGKWARELAKKGQHHAPLFIDARSSTGRMVHAVGISVADSLPVVVGLHGSPGSADAFMDYLADTMFTAQVRFLAVDRPGFGYTEFGHPETSLTAQALDLKAALERFAPGTPAVLVGHSLGGPLIVRFAIDHPDLVQGLVIVSGSVDPDLEPHPWWQKPIDQWPLRWLIPRSMWSSNHEIIALEEELRRMAPQWSAIRCPVRIVHAVDDRLVPFANAAYSRKMLVAACEVRLDSLGSGDHFILWNRREVITSAVLDLVRH